MSTKKQRTQSIIQINYALFTKDKIQLEIYQRIVIVLIVLNMVY